MYEICVKVDTNDGDYVNKISDISEDDLNKIRPLISAIKNFKFYDSNKGIHAHYHNWPNGECLREDLGELTPLEIYKDFDESLVEFFEDEFLPCCEYGFHTIKSIEVYPKPEKEKLL